jgi:hypothetical protein
MEQGSEKQCLEIIQKIGINMASLSIHKNGTWVIQKIIDRASCLSHYDFIVSYLKPFTPALFLDQYGNYVIQCCLRLKSHNQFVFDAISFNFLELGKGRFSSRSIKACLESKYTSNSQTKQVYQVLLNNCAELAVDSNGSIIISWFLEFSEFNGRYKAVSLKFVPRMIEMCCNKFSAKTIYKIGIIFL